MRTQRHFPVSFVDCLLLGLISLTSASAWAIEFDFGVGGTYSSFNYAEQPPAAKSQEAAVFPSFALESQIYFWPDFYLQLKYDHAAGIISSYTGSSLTTGAPESGTDNLAFTDAEADLYFPVWDAVAIYVGYAYRNWNRFLAGGSGYTENYSWYVTPIGVQWIFLDMGPCNLGIDASVRPTSNGTINVITSATVYGGQDTQMSLGSTVGYKIALPFKWHFYDRFDFWASIWYEHSQIGESNAGVNTTLGQSPNYQIVEPNSATDLYGLDTYVAYRF